MSDDSGIRVGRAHKPNKYDADIEEQEFLERELERELGGADSDSPAKEQKQESNGINTTTDTERGRKSTSVGK